MSRTLFLADIHLQRDNKARERLFATFMDRHLSPGDGLFILGDLFDYWANNATVFHAYAWVFDQLRLMARSGCRIGQLIGNRDFLLRRQMVESYGIEYLGEEAEINAGGKRLFLAHGHTLCLSDTRFLRYRARMWPVFRALDRILPGCIENRLAVKFQQQSKKVILGQEQSRFMFTRSALEEKFRAGFDCVICGHTHRQESFCEGPHCFYALPAWSDDTGNYLEFTHGELKLRTFQAKGIHGIP